MTIHPHDLTPGKIAESAACKVHMLDPVARFSLRAHEPERKAVADALELDLPWYVGDVAKTGETEVLNLGPDEWLIVAPEGQTDFASRTVDAPHALTDISDRELTFRITGPRASDLLTLGCPRDPDSIKPGQGRRTLFDSATVVLWRDGENDFRMDIWRSFAPHAVSLLALGCAELAAE
ncbi:sarcosine oxidase subunit gamma [Maribius pontilimi]|uniref:Sarcosine oxidase subunit gamma n=1 Tax=Palleronia pontilimi TaxID=1964209 RepID=A0A934IKA4_9RHOB|nr:sarcosine oxidase subunit gamma family protein [Palleronia pontilimi]MBJ3764517.1 sarcosine oxidase subunit gamma [Palleronia pontilimi]